MDKRDLRAVVRDARSARSAQDREDSARRLRAAAGDLAALTGAAIAAFQPTNGEPDIGPLLIDLMTRHGVTVLVPRTAPGHSLEWVTADAAMFATELHGIPRPSGPVVAHGADIAGMVDVMLVPALAVDPGTGARLGYGAGYYDRLLAGLPAPVRIIAVCDEDGLIAFTADDHDVPVDAVLTADGLVAIRGRATPAGGTA